MSGSVPDHFLRLFSASTWSSVRAKHSAWSGVAKPPSGLVHVGIINGEDWIQLGRWVWHHAFVVHKIAIRLLENHCLHGQS